MTPDEKKVSFLNKFFIFKKVRDVNAEQVEKILTNQDEETSKQIAKENVVIEKSMKQAEKKPRVKKLGKLKLKGPSTKAPIRKKIKLGRIRIKPAQT